jgi:thioredoxin reductase (NADPH)
MPISTKVLIIGSGAAGYTAAIYAARAGLDPIVISGLQPGGQLTITTDVENMPGFPDGVQGPELMEKMRAQAERFGTRVVVDTVVEVDLSARPIKAVTDNGDIYEGETLIIATGAQARWLGIESEQRFNGFGVSACATCDGFFYRGKNVVVIGGGNTAVEEALYLANLAAKVTLVHRRDSLRAEKILQERLFAHPKIEVIWDHAVDEVLGDLQPLVAVNGLRIKHVRSGATQLVAVDGVFIAIGHDPAVSLFKGQVQLDESGCIKVDQRTMRLIGTDAPAWGAGDVAGPVTRQAVVAAGMGCIAALEAEKFLAAMTPATQAEAA